jgi:hypothetical protein
MSGRTLWVVCAFITILAAVLTWPQVLHPATQVVGHENLDPYFSMWRLAWVAHALRTDPRHLFDANIFHPAPHTLAFSDATLLQGLLAAPFIWAGAPLVLVYNGVLFVGIIGSGVAMFVLVRYLTGSTSAALVSAAFFTVMPYRVEHIMHLELQWAMWLPLGFWAAHRAVGEGSSRFGAVAGLCVGLQVMSSVYYGVLLAALLVPLGFLLAATQSRGRRPCLVALLWGGVVAAALTLPYAWPYIENARVVGLRDDLKYSATPISYVTAPRGNWIWGTTSGRFPGDERHLMPGAVAAGLALLAFAGRPRRDMWIYLAIGAAAVELSLGPNGVVLSRFVSDYTSLRSMARFSVGAFCALAVLAGFGMRYLYGRFPRLDARILTAAACLLIVVESASAPLPLIAPPPIASDLSRILRTLEPGPIIELPIARVDPLYEYWSVAHWRPLVNGYSGYSTVDYQNTVGWMKIFPDDPAIAKLKELRVRYVVLHAALFSSEELDRIIERASARADLAFEGRFHDGLASAVILKVL